jgi:putative nucleotidyltransferase with HDIG domain
MRACDCQANLAPAVWELKKNMASYRSNSKVFAQHTAMSLENERWRKAKQQHGNGHDPLQDLALGVAPQGPPSLLETVVQQAALLLSARNGGRYPQTLSALSTVLATYAWEIEGHSRRAARLACAIAQEMDMRGSDLVSLFQGGLFHDVGKIGIPDAILHKPGPLSDTEWEIMRQHPAAGASILWGIGFPERALEVVLYHHEHYDGGGYPLGLQGEEIPLVARIFAVADAYDAMTTERPHRSAMSHAEAVTEIIRHSGTQFDPQVVRAFLKVVRRQATKTPVFQALALSPL